MVRLSGEGGYGAPVVMLEGRGEAANGVGEGESGQKRTSGGGAGEVDDVVVDEDGERAGRGDRQSPLQKVVQGALVGCEGRVGDGLKEY